MRNRSLDLLQKWYLDQCDGDWEHEFGVKIDTLDNPGWKVNIDLVDTDLEGKNFSEICWEKNEQNWVQCDVKKCQFQGAGGSQNLNDIIEIFLNWAQEGNL
ncbi:immunity 53 family protein [Candidatus Neptunochlamydia vexilliferae]|uniref:Rhodanese-related sulfurtransferase n=1 Tax=Candidatus Neptunichlamydia vexilliferae TaxID=1651774 RepID=A0ABS0AYN9_9BACT|nr:immunity 53 family protein [Candidatus Neptunochlamydia vexilliferae]MBF5058596.1 hypothetical protein [Candidatus Neptunochlamydia vexilliferae]